MDHPDANSAIRALALDCHHRDKQKLAVRSIVFRGAAKNTRNATRVFLLVATAPSVATDVGGNCSGGGRGRRGRPRPRELLAGRGRPARVHG